MKENEARSLAKEYQSPRTTDNRREDILLIFFQTFHPYITTWAWAGDDSIQEAHIGIHDLISSWTKKSHGDILKNLFSTIKNRSMMQYTTQFRRHWKNRVGGDVSSVEVKMTGRRENNPYYKFHQRTMNKFYCNDEENIYENSIPPISDLLRAYFLEGFNVPTLHKKFKLVNIDKTRKMLLKEINDMRVANGVEPFDNLQQAKASPLPEKVQVRLWFAKNRERQKEYYRKAKAKGKYKTYADTAKKKRQQQALNGYQ